MTGRRDCLGRRIGANWWRSFIVETLHCADAVWHERLEDASCGYETEAREFTDAHPRPTLKALLIAHAGMALQEEATCL